MFNRSDALDGRQRHQRHGHAARKLGAGTTTLTGANTYSGTTTISAGTLQVGSGGTTGTLGTGAVVDNGALVFNRSNALTVANAISGTGTLQQARRGHDDAHRHEHLQRDDDDQRGHAAGRQRRHDGHARHAAR